MINDLNLKIYKTRCQKERNSYCILILSMQTIQKSAQVQLQQQKQLVSQLYMLIAALKDELIILQSQVQRHILQKQHFRQELSALRQQNELLKQKNNFIIENNNSLLSTFQVFQRQFLKRDYTNTKTNSGLPFFVDLISTLKTKITYSSPILKKTDKRSNLGDYYGYFFEQTAEQYQIELFNQVAQKKKSPKLLKIKSHGKRNFFNENFRHLFWFNMIENKLNITERLYEILCEQLEEKNKPITTVLLQDLRRTDVKLDSSEAKIVIDQIQKLLQLFEIYRPDIGYIQGMTYFAWMFVIRMDPCLAFSCFANVMITDPFIKALYMFDELKIKQIVLFFSEILNDKKPRLSKHIQASNVQIELFLIEWAFTFYSRAFNLRIVSKIWDLWFSQGYNVFFKVAMVIFEMMEGQILQQTQNDKIIEIIRGGTYKLNEEEFIRLLIKQKLFQDLRLQ